MWVDKPTSGVSRGAFSPNPVSVGVYSRCPASWKRGMTFFQHHAPCQPPCTNTYVAMLRSFSSNQPHQGEVTGEERGDATRVAPPKTSAPTDAARRAPARGSALTVPTKPR